MSNLYLSMTEKLTAHWKTNSSAYPQKFVLSPALRDEYLKCLSYVTSNQGKTVAVPDKHMGVIIEIVENTPGVMVAADGTEVTLQ